MTTITNLKRWAVLITILVMGLPSLVLGDDLFALEGESLSVDEMADTRGGMSLPGGGFLEFSMDYMRLKFLGTNDPETSYASSWFNSVSQKAIITDDGIQFDLDILQGQSGEESEGTGSFLIGGNNMNRIENPSGGSLSPNQLNSILAQNSFQGFSGISNANLIAGDNNVAAISNIFNIKVNFFSGKDFTPTSALGLVLH